MGVAVSAGVGEARFATGLADGEMAGRGVSGSQAAASRITARHKISLTADRLIISSGLIFEV
jgi:hypothetical protein